MDDEGNPIEQAAMARRERLMALRSANELLNPVDEKSADSGVEEVKEAEEGLNAASDEENSIENASMVSRVRLMALRRANEKSPDNDDEDIEETDVGMRSELKFRNYLPRDEQLQEGKLPPAILPKFEDPVAVAPAAEKIENPFMNIAPKKPNWDLKRDVQKRLDILDRRTLSAIHKLASQQEAERRAQESNGTVED